MTKNYIDSNVSDTAITAEKNPSLKRQSTDLWSQYGHFKQQCSEFSLQKTNMNELTLLHVNQGSLTYKNDQKFYYGDTYILGQIVPLADSPDDLSSYELKPNEVKLLRPKYDFAKGHFLGMVETLGFTTV